MHIRFTRKFFLSKLPPFRGKSWIELTEKNRKLLKSNCLFLNFEFKQLYLKIIFSSIWWSNPKHFAVTSHAHPKETHFLTYLKRIIRSFREAKSYTGRKRHNMNCIAETKAMSLPSMSCDPQRSKRRRKGWHVWPPELPKGIVNCIFLRWVLTGEICLDRCCLTFLSLKQCCQLF